MFDPQTGALSVTTAAYGMSASGTCTPAAAGTPVQLVPAWATATAYVPGNVRLDTDNTTWVCLVGHTSGSGNFAADRAAHPTYWQQIAACKFVWVGAPVSAAGVALNQQPVFIGAFSAANEQNIPIMPANFEGMPIPICDPSKIWVQSSRAGDAVVFRIFT
jgi:hypothetical protein